VPFSMATTWFGMTHSRGKFVVPHAMLELAIAYCGTLLLGLPTYLLMIRFGAVTLGRMLLASAILGLVFPMTMAAITGEGIGASFSLIFYVYSVGYALAIAFAFWLIARPSVYR
jgi:hypothetical protein